MYMTTLSSKEQLILDENDKRVTTALEEMAEQACRNKRDSGMNCKEYCLYYGTNKCRHPEKLFPNN